MQFSYEYHNQTYTIDLMLQADGSYTARIAGQEVTFRASQSLPGTWILHMNGRQQVVHTAIDTQNRYIHLEGVQYQLERTTGRRRRNKSSAGSGGLVAEMPGQVIDVRVSAGDAVESGQVLLVLEAMKMEIRISAPDQGIVANVLVAAGDVVERGQHLVEFQPGAE